MSGRLPLDATYLLPLRWERDEGRAELAAYVQGLAAHCHEVLVVDGSPAEVYRQNARVLTPHARHLLPAPEHACAMGKVAGVNTGVRAASCERIVIADDDVRYTTDALARAVALLDRHDLVRPQNYFQPLPWHARWDTARTLLNRALTRDFPGTLAVRRSRLLAAGGYDGDVMFENLELIRTIEASGGTCAAPLDLYVRRLPPTSGRFWGQRTRQAYDDLAIPLRMACWLAVLPALALAAARRRPRPVLAVAASLVAVAERGRRRAGGASVFPASSSLLAPVWVLERGVCSWLALMQRVRHGGVRYNGGVIRTAAHSRRALRRRLSAGVG